MRARHLVVLLFVTGCRCAELPDFVFACDDAGACPDAMTCVDGFCVNPMLDDAGARDGGDLFDGGCQPTVLCGSDQCGSFGDDGCGRPLECGDCSAPFVCGLHVANRCECDLVTSAAQVCPDAGANTCGDITIDNCGTIQTFRCGDEKCADDNPCYENLCCTPPTDQQLCTTARFGCGPGQAYDSCGTLRSMQCGGCSGMTPVCVANDMGSVCVPASCVTENDHELCNRLGANCGVLANAVDNCGVMRTNVTCGGLCDAGECTSPVANQCVCQSVLQGCTDNDHCCGGDGGVTVCNKSGLCCTRSVQACGDDGECCSGLCSAGACCERNGSACTAAKECCSGVCGSDGGCQYVDAGSTYDGGEL